MAVNHKCNTILYTREQKTKKPYLSSSQAVVIFSNFWVHVSFRATKNIQKMLCKPHVSFKETKNQTVWRASMTICWSEYSQRTDNELVKQWQHFIWILNVITALVSGAHCLPRPALVISSYIRCNWCLFLFGNFVEQTTETRYLKQNVHWKLSRFTRRLITCPWRKNTRLSRHTPARRRLLHRHRAPGWNWSVGHSSVAVRRSSPRFGPPVLHVSRARSSILLTTTASGAPVSWEREVLNKVHYWESQDSNSIPLQTHFFSEKARPTAKMTGNRRDIPTPREYSGFSLLISLCSVGLVGAGRSLAY